MKGLLHSKRFRTNLYKWLFMYVGVITLLTTVVTYSKYISSITINGTATTAKFNPVLTQVDYDCENDYTDACTYIPTGDIVYKFSVDTTDVEVLAKMQILLKVNNTDFEIISVSGVKDEDTLTLSESNTTGVIFTKAKLTSTTPDEYTVTIKYKNSVTSATALDPIESLLSVGYRIEQCESEVCSYE